LLELRRQQPMLQVIEASTDIHVYYPTEICFTDDFVIGCVVEAAARRFLGVLPKRFGRFGLTIHSQDTASIRFRKPQLNG